MTDDNTDSPCMDGYVQVGTTEGPDGEQVPQCMSEGLVDEMTTISCTRGTKQSLDKPEGVSWDYWLQELIKQVDDE